MAQIASLTTVSDTPAGESVESGRVRALARPERRSRPPSAPRSFTTAAAAGVGRTFRPSETTLAALAAATLSTATGREGGGAGPPSLKRWRCVNASASGRWRSARRRSGQRSSGWKSALFTIPRLPLHTTQPRRRHPRLRRRPSRLRRRPSRLPHRGPSAGCSTRRKCPLQLLLRVGISSTGAGTGGLQRLGRQQRLRWPLRGPWVAHWHLLQQPAASSRHTRPRVTRRRLLRPTRARAAVAPGGSTRGASATPRTRTVAAMVMVAMQAGPRARLEGGRRDTLRPRLETRATGPSWQSRRSSSPPLRRRRQQRRRTLPASRRLICQTYGGF